MVGDGLAAGGLDLVDHRLGGALVFALALERGAQVVHHDLGAHARELDRVQACPARPLRP